MKTLAIVMFALFTTTAWADTPVVIVTDGNMDLPQTVVTSEGTYLVIPNYSTGKPQAVIQTSKTKDKD